MNESGLEPGPLFRSIQKTFEARTMAHPQNVRMSWCTGNIHKPFAAKMLLMTGMNILPPLDGTRIPGAGVSLLGLHEGKGG